MSESGFPAVRRCWHGRCGAACLLPNEHIGAHEYTRYEEIVVGRTATGRILHARR